MRYRFAIFWILNMSVASHAIAETFVSVAPFTGNITNKNMPSVELVQTMVAACLSQVDSLAVVERADLNDLMAEKSSGMTGFNPNAIAPHLKGVDYVVTGSATPLNDKLIIALQASNPATTQMMAAYSATINSYQLDKNLCKSVVTPFADKLLHHRSTVTAVTQEDAQSEESTWLLKGISYVNNGAYAQAFPMFLKIIDRDPKNADAHYWLAISYAKAGMTEFAQKETAECFALAPEHPRRKELEQLLALPIKEEQHL